MFRGTLAAVACILLAGIAAAVPPAAPLDWIAGHWCLESGGQAIEELWLPPHGGVAIGIGRTRTGETTTAFEYLRILEVDGVLSYVAQPGGRPPTVFRYVHGGERWIRFENPAHDFPTRVEYRRKGDALHAEIAGPGENGEEQVVRSITGIASSCLYEAFATVAFARPASAGLATGAVGASIARDQRGRAVSVAGAARSYRGFGATR